MTEGDETESGVSDDFRLTDDKLRMVARCIELAEEHFEEPDSARYGQICWWDDGDFRVRIQHSFDREEEYTHRAETIRYKASAGRVVYSRYEQDLVGCEEQVDEEYVIEEVEPRGND